MQTTNEIIINVQELDPRVRHQTIFQTFDHLKLGESLIIHNNHDPRPVYYQLMDRRGNVFSWEYLEEGPEWWDIRVTRTVAPIHAEIEDFIINVPALEPSQKHATIFHVFENWPKGEHFIIHNDHDPRPLFFHLMEKHGEIFDWEYLTSGPEVWEIKVSLHPEAAADYGDEYVVNVPSLEPQLKHKTIFQAFENLQPGESFIIHNDHDPKPVYYQLMEMHGDIFTWEYLQQGPQWFDIRVRRKGETKSELRQDILVDVPSLEPRLKHPTIFQTFDSLQVGESMIIHNDHDPKPVYYQLLSERGEVFTWEYLQQGPQFWDIRVTRKGTEISETIGEIVAKDMRKAEVFKKFGIDFCCGGKKTVRQVCQEKGIDAQLVEKALQEPMVGNSSSTALNYDEWDLDFLADFIVNTHHSYVRKYMPEITGYAAKVAQVHGAHHPELVEINQLFNQVNQELSAHIVEEEKVLFPFIKEIVKVHNSASLLPVEGKSFAELIAETEEEHDHVGRAMEKIRALSDNYAIPSDACTSYKLLFKMLEEFEGDLFTHIHLENNILFVKAEEMEKGLK